MDIRDLTRDAAAIEAGQWIGDLPGVPGLRLRVRGFTADTVRRTRERKRAELSPGAIGANGMVERGEADRIGGEVLAEAVLLEWDGLTQDGEAVPFSAALARTLCTAEPFAAFRDVVTEAAMRADRTRLDGEAVRAAMAGAAPADGEAGE